MLNTILKASTDMVLSVINPKYFHASHTDTAPRFQEPSRHVLPKMMSSKKT